MNTNERYSRQQDIIPADRLIGCKATVIGIGAIGRQVALQLAAIGVPWLQLIDPDTVEESNLASQGYLERDLGRPKVQATGEQCQQINGNLEVLELDERFKRSHQIGHIIFNCVDSIETRQHIWNVVKEHVQFYCDGRMSAEVMRVLTVCEPPAYEYYPTTLFPQAQAYAGSCTAKSTIYCGNVAAGIMLSQLTKHLRYLPVEMDVQFNLLSMELSVDSK
jgi:hypothetical protein